MYIKSYWYGEISTLRFSSTERQAMLFLNSILKKDILNININLCPSHTVVQRDNQQKESYFPQSPV